MNHKRWKNFLTENTILQELRVHGSLEGAQYLIAYGEGVWLFPDTDISGFQRLSGEDAPETFWDLRDALEGEGRYDVLLGMIDGTELRLDTIGSYTRDPKSSVLIKKLVKALGISDVSYVPSGRDNDVGTRRPKIQGKIPDYAFHGTSTTYGEGILKFGLKPDEAESNYGEIKHSDKVFFATRFDEAAHHALHTSQKKGGEPLVLYFKIPDKDQIVPDYDVDVGGQDTAYQYISAITRQGAREHGAKMKGSSYSLSQEFGIYGYEGRIPSKFIEIYYVVLNAKEEIGDDYYQLASALDKNYEEQLGLTPKEFRTYLYTQDEFGYGTIEMPEPDGWDEEEEDLDESLLDEGLSSVLYHVAPVPAALQILHDDRFMTSVAVGTPADYEKNRGKSYFLSMARSTMSSYVRNAGLYSVLFKLNGNKLAQKYKGAAVDYWSNAKYAHMGPSDRSHGKSEMEDRVIVDKPYIVNASKYIEELHVNAAIVENRYNDIYENSLTNIRDVLQYAKERNIPAWVYTSERDFIRLNRKHAFRTYDKFLNYVKNSDKEIKAPYDRYQGHKFEHDFGNLPEFAAALKLLASRSDEEYEKADYKTKHIIYWVQRYPGEAVSHMNIDISNERKNPDARELIHTIIGAMKKAGMSQMKEFIPYIAGEFEKLGWRGSY